MVRSVNRETRLKGGRGDREQQKMEKERKIVEDGGGTYQ
jgi:hypothetical protein